MIVETKPLIGIGRDGTEKKTTEISIIVDDKLAGFVGNLPGNGIRIHHGKFTDEQLETIRQEVEAQIGRDVPTIVQVFELDMQKKNRRVANLT